MCNINFQHVIGLNKVTLLPSFTQFLEKIKNQPKITKLGIIVELAVYIFWGKIIRKN